MQKSDGRILLSASDLTYFSGCTHRTWLDRLNLDAPMERAPDDEQSKLLQVKGLEHEAEFFSRLQKNHVQCVEINTALSLDQRIAATKQAILDGAEVIYQGSLQWYLGMGCHVPTPHHRNA